MVCTAGLQSRFGVFFAESAPAVSQLTAGVYILLTDRCAASDAATAAPHRNWLLNKDPLARIGSFTKNHPQHQQLFRTYLSQYVLHANSEDNPVVAALSGYMEADLCLAHILRDILVIDRPEAYMSLTDFFRQYKSPAKLLQLYLDDSYGALRTALRALYSGDSAVVGISTASAVRSGL